MIHYYVQNRKWGLSPYMVLEMMEPLRVEINACTESHSSMSLKPDSVVMHRDLDARLCQPSIDADVSSLGWAEGGGTERHPQDRGTNRSLQNRRVEGKGDSQRTDIDRFTDLGAQGHCGHVMAVEQSVYGTLVVVEGGLLLGDVVASDGQSVEGSLEAGGEDHIRKSLGRHLNARSNVSLSNSSNGLNG